MLDMLLFFVVYGVWTFSVWSGFAWVCLLLTSKLVEWVTNNDFTLKDYCSLREYENNLGSIFGILFTCSFSGVVINLPHSLLLLLKPDEIISHHDLAVKVSDWVVNTLSTPLIFIIIAVCLGIVAKISYSRIKRICLAVERLENEPVDNKEK